MEFELSSAPKITLEHMLRIEQNVPTCFFNQEFPADYTKNL